MPASGPVRATKPVLGGEMTAADAWREIARTCLRQIRANEDGFLARSDPEHLHQLRIGWRRLRCALSMPRDPDWRDALGALRPELRWLSGVLGTARNWDVFTTEMLPSLAPRFPRGSARERERAAYLSRCARLRRRHEESARAAVRSERYRQLVLGLERTIAAIEHSAPSLREEKARGFAKAVLKRQRRKLKKKHPDAELSVTSARERHPFRIAAKKLRYAGELLRDLFPGTKAGRYTRRAANLQDALGDANDLANGLRMVEEAAGSRDPAADASIVQLIRNRLRAQEQEKLSGLDGAWRRFKKREPFWRRSE